MPFGSENAFIPESSLIPDGPSSQHTDGILCAIKFGDTPANADAVPAVTRELPIPSPRTKHARSSSSNCAINSSMVALPSLTSRSVIPLSPVTGISSGSSCSLLSYISTVTRGVSSYSISILPFSSQNGFMRSNFSYGASAS